MGFGRIGREMAKKARAFNMKILYYDKIQFPREVEEEYGAEYAPLHKLLTFNSIEWIQEYNRLGLQLVGTTFQFH